MFKYLIFFIFFAVSANAAPIVDELQLPVDFIAEDGVTVVGGLRTDAQGRLCFVGPNQTSCVMVFDLADKVGFGSNVPSVLDTRVTVDEDMRVLGHLALGPIMSPPRSLDPDGAISLYRALDPGEIGAFSVGRVYTMTPAGPAERHRWVVDFDGVGCLTTIPSDVCP